QPDSLTTNVAAQHGEAKALLNLYRQVLHLRRQAQALPPRQLVPLSTPIPQLAAYLRRTSRRAVLVVANLAAAPVSGVALGWRDSVLPPGRYTPRNLLGGPNGTTLQVSRDGRIQGYIPAAAIGSRESLVLDLIRR